MNWVCKCGKTFEKKAQYNGHISICKEFLGEEKYLEYLNRRKIKLKKDFLIDINVEIFIK